MIVPGGIVNSVLLYESIATWPLQRCLHMIVRLLTNGHLGLGYACGQRSGICTVAVLL